MTHGLTGYEVYRPAEPILKEELQSHVGVERRLAFEIHEDVDVAARPST